MKGFAMDDERLKNGDGDTIYRCSDSNKEHMELITWKEALNGKIQKFDVVIAKN